MNWGEFNWQDWGGMKWSMWERFKWWGGWLVMAGLFYPATKAIHFTASTVAKLWKPKHRTEIKGDDEL